MEISQGGTDAAFALEFHAALTLEEFEPERAPAPMLIHMGSAHYELLGQVVHVSNRGCGSTMKLGSVGKKSPRPMRGTMEVNIFSIANGRYTRICEPSRKLVR
jgi:hypothetical protein